jgi:hypothetical protein
MSCCGHHRKSIRTQVTGAVQSNQAVLTTAATQPLGSVVLASGVTLQCRERMRMQVRGPITGRTYIFEPTQATVVDARDAEALLRTRHFLRSSLLRR